MPGLDPAIPLSVQTPQFVNPLQLAMQASQMQAARAETQQRRFALLEAQQKAAEDDQFREAIRSSAGMTSDQLLEHVRTTAPGAYLPVQKAIQEAQEKAAMAKKATAEAEASHAQAELHQQQYISHLADQMAQSDYNPAVVNTSLNEAVEHFPGWQGHADQIRQIAATQGKDALKAAIAPLIGADIQKAHADAASTTAKVPGEQAASAIAQQVASGMKDGLTPEQQRQATDRRASLSLEGQRLALEKQKAADARSDITQLTPEGLDAAAKMFAQTGQLPALGMGDKQTRKQIINRAAALMPGLDLASAKADFHANSESLKTTTKTLDTVSAFENTAGKNLDMFLDLAKKVPDTGVPWINSPIRALNAKVAGNANQAAFNAARDVALREIARVTNDPKLSGALSDHARAEVQALAPASATFAQIKAVAQTLRQDMANVHSSLSDQRDAIAARIKAGSPSTADQPKPAAAANPNGYKVGDVVIVKGQKVKISALHPDGSFDGSEIK